MKAALETRKLKNSRAGRDADRYFNTKANKNSIPEKNNRSEPHIAINMKDKKSENDPKNKIPLM